MRTLWTLILLLLVSVAAPARADHAAIDLRIVVPTDGTTFPERDGTAVRLGPSLLTAPFAIETAKATGSAVQLTLAPATAKWFAELTAAHQGQKLAILAGGVVQSAPVIRDPITGGKVSITLRSAADATALARSLTTR